MMDVWQFVDRVDGYGSDKYALSLASSLKPEHATTVLYLSSRLKVEEKCPQIGFIKLDEATWISRLLKVRKLITRHEPQILHCHQPRATLIGVLAATLTRTRAIVTIHQSTLLTARSVGWPKGLIKALASIAAGLLVEMLASRVVHVSHTMCRRHFTFWKGTTIHNWVQLPGESNNQTETRSGKRKVILTIGRVSDLKGYPEMVELLSRAYTAGLSFSWWIVGDGNAQTMTWLRRTLSKNGLSGQVTIFGYDDMPTRYYERADVFLSLSRTESFGLAVAEAMAHGLPLVVSDIPVFREIVPESNLFLSRYRLDVNGFVSYVQSSCSLATIGTQNRRRVSAWFDPHVQTDRMVCLYNEASRRKG